MEGAGVSLHKIADISPRSWKWHWAVRLLATIPNPQYKDHGTACYTASLNSEVRMNILAKERLAQIQCR
jgi:hypothetical protein